MASAPSRAHLSRDHLYVPLQGFLLACVLVPLRAVPTAYCPPEPDRDHLKVEVPTGLSITRLGVRNSHRWVPPWILTLLHSRGAGLLLFRHVNVPYLRPSLPGPWLCIPALLLSTHSYNFRNRILYFLQTLLINCCKTVSVVLLRGHIDGWFGCTAEMENTTRTAA